MAKAQKYFRAPLTSKVLRACDVLFSSPLDEVKNKFQTVTSRFSNVIKNEQVPDLLDQISSLHSRKDIKEFATTMTPVQIFGRLVTWRDGRYSLIGHLAFCYFMCTQFWSNGSKGLFFTGIYTLIFYSLFNYLPHSELSGWRFKEKCY